MRFVLGLAAGIAALVPAGATPATTMAAPCLITVGTICVNPTVSLDTECIVNVGYCEPDSGCVVNIGYCETGGNCTVNAGHCRAGDNSIVRL